MLEDELISCPVCDKDLQVKVMRMGKNPTYLVSNECPNCKTPAGKIEKALNSMGKKHYVKVEKSYLKEFNKPK